MKNYLLLLIILLWFTQSGLSQVIDSSAQWTWVSGSSGISQPTIGTLGSTATTNTPNGRTGFGTWRDNAGNFWLFGGQRVGGYGNDLWKYDPVANTWTWVTGSATDNIFGTYTPAGSPSLTPGSRSSPATWVDATGNLWLFGGYGYAASGSPNRLSDLWKFNPATSQWTYVSGATTSGTFGVYGASGVFGASYLPGGRSSPSGVTDAAGNFWLFSGYGFGASGSAGVLNDLWKFNPVTNQWAYIKGNSTTNSTATFAGSVTGSGGTFDPANLPGGRYIPTMWIDLNGIIWLFGGSGAGSGTNYLNDLWKYDPSLNQWAFVKGSATVNQTSVFGTKGVGNAANTPGARYGCAVWLDVSGNPWLFGGVTGSTANRMNELWKYDPALNQWTWMKGVSTVNPISTYGTKGTTDVLNSPSGKYNLGNWTDAAGNFWLFGGWGFATNTTLGVTNDMWRLAPPPCAVTITASRPLILCQGDSVILKAKSNTAGLTYQWYEGVTPVGTDTAYVAKAAGSYTVKITGTSCNNISAPTVVTVNPLPAVYIELSPAAAAICPGKDTSLVASGGVSYSWSPSAGLNTTTGNTVRANPTGTTTYTVEGTGANGCIGVASRMVTVNSLPSITITPATAIICKGKDTALTATGGATYTWNPAGSLSAATGAIVHAAPTATTIYTVTGTDNNGCQSTAIRTVTVNDLPIIAISPATAVICAGKDSVLTASGGAAYGWLPTTGLNTASGAIVRAAPATTTTYTVTGMDANGCTNTAIRTVTVNQNPVVTINPPTAAICLGNDTSFTASGATTYSWSPSIGLNAISGAVVTANPTTTTNYIVTGIDGNNCIGKDTQVVVVKTLPVATITPGGQIGFCEFDSVLLTANNVVGANNTYQWGNGTTYVGTDFTYMAKAGGSYTVTVKDTAGCQTTSAATVVAMNARPSVVVALSGKTDFCQGGFVMLNIPLDTGTSYQWLRDGIGIPFAGASFYQATESGLYKVIATRTGIANCDDTSQEVPVVVYPLPLPVIQSEGALLYTDSTYVSYQWFYVGVAISGASSWKHKATQDGSYLVAVTDSNGCSNQSPGYTIRRTDIEDLNSLAASIDIYPNPASTHIYIASPVVVNVQICNITGQQILYMPNAKNVDISTLPVGLYLVHIINADGVIMKIEKIIKQ